MDFDPDTLTPEKLHRLRQAAEGAWGDDTRHPNYVGHPNPSAGQCYVTSAWLQSILGGHVGIKDGHSFWVSPDRTHALDLTGDKLSYEPEGREAGVEPWNAPPPQPGPVLFKRADHPAFKGFRIVEAPENPRAKVFKQRADAILSGRKTADGNASGSDAYPGETAQAIEDWNQKGLTLHDEPEYEPESNPVQYQFVWANGRLQVSPSHGHDRLLAATGSEGEGPVAVGYADVRSGHVTWRVEANVGLQGLRDVLAHYSHQVGWKFDGLVGTDGQPMGLDLGPIMSFWYQEKGDTVQIAKTPLAHGKRIQVTGSTAWVEKIHPGLEDWAGDLGVRLAEYPGGGNMLDKMKNQEWLDTFNNADPNFQPERQGLEEEPGGPFVCPQCGAKPASFGEYKLHMSDHERMEQEPFEDGHFPRIQPQDEPLGFGTQPSPNGNQTIARTSSLEEWEPGRPGKGAININPNDPDDEFMQTWNTDRLGQPYHGDRVDYPYHSIMIAPSGHYTSTEALNGRAPEGREHEFAGHPGLTYVPNAAMWQKQYDRGRYGSIEPFVIGTTRHEAKRIPEFELYSNLFGFGDDCEYYGAYSNGELLGYGVVRPGFAPEVLMIQSSVHGRGVGTAILRHIQSHYDNFYSHADTDAGAALMRRCGMVNTTGHKWVYAAGEPKDMIEQDVPFVYDIPNDRLHLGYPGQKTHDVGQGQLTPGGLVEGYYQPGGKVVIQTASTWPFSFRHLLDLWYHTAPQMEVTSLEEIGPDGKNQKLAGESVGQYIKALLPSDVAANAAYGALRAKGGKVYAVGGAPRDALQGRVPNDIDLMVSGIPQEDVQHILKTLARKTGGNVTFAGKNFGVFHYHQGPDTVEIALPRSDDYGDGGRRSDGNITVDHDLPIDQDLMRRDFTANALAVDLDSGQLVDPHGGADDIKRGVLRTTHPNSFREDPSRLIRALTMHGRFGLIPDERTRHEMAENAHLLRGESPDLLNKSFTKTMGSDNPASAVRLAHDTGLLQHLLPETDKHWDFDQNNPHHSHTLGEHVLQVLDNTSRLTTDPDVRLAALLHDVGKPYSAWVDPQTGENHYYLGPEGQGAYHEQMGADLAGDRLRNTFNLQRARINRITHLINHHMFAPFTSPKGARKFIARVGDEHVDDLLNLRQADQEGKGQGPEELAARTSADSMRDLVNQVRVAGNATTPAALSVNGNDLIAMGLRQGPAVGSVLQSLMNHVLDNPEDNQRDRLLQVAQSYVQAQPQ